MSASIIEGHTGFDPAVHGWHFVNHAGAYGDVTLDPVVFGSTYGLAVGRDKFFRKLYRDILGATHDERGQPTGAPLSSGLCTGMIRSAIELFQTNATPPAHDRTPTGATLDMIKTLHGRQLTDRALLYGAYWLLAGSPRRVFRAFRDAVTAGYNDPVAFDIGVPSLRRRDFARAIQAEGHTVIPYAFRQIGDNYGEIFIYDPNHPVETSTPELREPAIKFDLARNTYFYTERYQSVRPNGDATTIIATPQSAYRNGRSAILASIANFVI